MDLTKSMDERIQQETAALERERRGEATITVGKALLGVGLILVCFVGISVRTGSRLFIWWVIVEGLLGFLLVAIGVYQKAEAHKKLKALEPKQGRAVMPSRPTPESSPGQLGGYGL